MFTTLQRCYRSRLHRAVRSSSWARGVHIWLSAGLAWSTTVGRPWLLCWASSSEAGVKFTLPNVRPSLLIALASLSCAHGLGHAGTTALCTDPTPPCEQPLLMCKRERGELLKVVVCLS